MFVRGGTAAARMLAVAVLVLVGACAPRTYVVLLDQPDGKTGAVTVETEGGSQTIETPGQATAFGSASRPPGEPFAVSDEQLGRDFGDAIGAQPEPPAMFLIYFFSDSTRLKADSEAKLPAILTAIGRRAAPDISVVGHSDRFGDEGYNNRLALRRARAIRDAIVNAGIDAASIDVTSHGENDPLVPTADNVREPRNRRVEVFVR